MESGKIWFVTGASAGLGLALVKALLEQGHRVAATSRDVDALLEATGAALDGRLLPLAVDLGDERSVRRAVDAAHAAFGGGAHGLQQAFGVIPFGRHAVQAGGKTQGFHCGWIR